MNRSSRFRVKADLKRSHGSYLYDINSNRELLDLFGMYSSLPLGYNHPVFSSEAFKEEILGISHTKVTNCEVLTPEAEDFHARFLEFVGGGYSHYCCTGALAVESAIKTAMDYTDGEEVISFQGSFHGINGYASLATSRFDGVSNRLSGLLDLSWPKVYNPTYINFSSHPREEGMQRALSRIEDLIVERSIAAILVEPIQSTVGDRYFPDEFFIDLRNITSYFNIPLIFDEVQTGFGATGEVWYSDYLSIDPDITVFGKKSQISGILVDKDFSDVFDTSPRLEVTWDGTLFDMIRCKYIIQGYQEYGLLDNIVEMGSLLQTHLLTLDGPLNVRGLGGLIAFELESQELRDRFSTRLLEKGVLHNPTGKYTIRFRPNLAITQGEIEHAASLIERALLR